MTDTQPRQSPNALIANHVVRIVNEYTGRGPTRARAHLTEDLVTVVLEDSLTKAERTLVATGHGDQVETTRLTFQKTMADDLVAGVEEILGRKVYAFLSANNTSPDVAIESFVLEPLQT